MTTSERIEKVLADWPETGKQTVAVAADEIARELIDQDVSASEYEGCSSELDMAYVDYEAEARRVIERRREAVHAAHH